MLQTLLALAEVGKMKALKAERVLKGQMMTDSWAVIKKRRNLKWSESYRTHTHTHTPASLSISVTFQVREDSAFHQCSG